MKTILMNLHQNRSAEALKKDIEVLKEAINPDYFPERRGNLFKNPELLEQLTLSAKRMYLYPHRECECVETDDSMTFAVSGQILYVKHNLVDSQYVFDIADKDYEENWYCKFEADDERNIILKYALEDILPTK